MLQNRFTDYRVLSSSIYAPSISLLAPAYNEGKNIAENVRSLLSIFYTNMEIIVINDGSTDNSLQILIELYELEKRDYFVSYEVESLEIKGVYKSRNPLYNKLIVIDKENGGKSDSLNAGINISSNKYLICIDADCILEQDALLKMMKPFLKQTEGERVIASGGVIRVANSCDIENGELIKVNMPLKYLPRIQVLEYIRAFILGRMAWSRLNGLLIISGAFGAFDKEIVIKCGGYSHKTVGEDMELVVRMRRYMEDLKLKYRITYIPDPLCWTEVPESISILGRQRNRWMRGTIETMYTHKKLFLNPSYGVLGLLSYPYWFFFEMCAPIIEIGGFVLLVILALLHLMNWDFFFLYLLCILLFSYLYSAFAILMEVLTFHQYKRRIDVFSLLLTSLTEPFIFHPFIVISSARGYFDYFFKNKVWGIMTRKGFTLKSVKINNFKKSNILEANKAEIKNNEKNKWGGPNSHESRFIFLFSRLLALLYNSFKYYLPHFILLTTWVFLTSLFEISYDIKSHGLPKMFSATVGLICIKDFSFSIFLGVCFFPFFTLLYSYKKMAAHLYFIIAAVFIILLQFILSAYFVTALVPLGADVWGYSLNDIKQTVGASAVINIYAIGGFILLLIIVSASFIYFTNKINLKPIVSVGSLLLFLILALINMSAISDKWLPGEEFSNMLCLNKANYFFKENIIYFFPSMKGNTLNEDNLSDDSHYTGNDTTVVQMNYINEKEYPFLHTIDTTVDVLTPFFNKSNKPPNIVFLIVEGLGRAFTNQGAYLGNFTPFIDSLAGQSLYWKNFLSEGGRTFAVLPSLLGSLPFAKSGFTELGDAMPEHLSILNIAEKNAYKTSFFYGGDAHFDNMDIFLQKNHIGKINDQKSFPETYTKLPAGASGFSWGYGDKELFRRYFEVIHSEDQPYLNIVLTVSTHSPFLINEQERYLDRFEERMTELGFNNKEKAEHRFYKYQYASILFMNDAVKNFIEQYKLRPDFANTVFIITGDHRMPEIPMSTKIDRYHVPLLIYSALLKRRAVFSSISTHFDVTPSIATWLTKSYHLITPLITSWMGTGLDTTRYFRNIHAYPFMQTKNEIIDFVMGKYMINDHNLFQIEENMDLTPISNQNKANQLESGFDKFTIRNLNFIKTNRLMSDSLLRFYNPL